MKNLFLIFIVLLTLGFESFAQNYYRRPFPTPRPYPTRPYPYPAPLPYPTPAPYPVPLPYPVYPLPVLPQPYVVTCYAQGLANGLVYYGVGPDIYTANQRALIICQSAGQYCQSIGCQY